MRMEISAVIFFLKSVVLATAEHRCTFGTRDATGHSVCGNKNVHGHMTEKNTNGT